MVSEDIRGRLAGQTLKIEISENKECGHVCRDVSAETDEGES